jgi:outer membrane protein TolC
MKTALVSAALLTTSLIAGIASAQAPRPAQPTAQPRAPAATPPAPAVPPAPRASPSVGAAPAAATEPTLPTIDDPMLAPAPPAAQVLTSWRQAIDLVRSKSTTLRSSLARVDQASAQARQALAVALPKLSAGADVTTHLIRTRYTDQFGQRLLAPDPATTWGAGLDLRVPVFAPAAWYDHGTSTDAIDASKLDVKETERQVVAGVADAIVTAVTAERLAEVSRVSLASVLSTLDLNKRRAALGASSQLDVLRVEQEVQLARAQVVSADEGLLQAREALGLALGTSQGVGVTADIRIDALADDARTVCRPERDVGKRPDVLAATAQVGIAERRKDGVSRTYWPTVDAVSNLTYFGEQTIPGGTHFGWTVGGELRWLLYDGGARYGRSEELEATTRVAREQLNDTRRRAELEVVQATRAVRVATSNLAVSARAREIAAETSRLAKVAFMNGSGTSFDLVDTARRLREAELDFAIKEFDLLRARVAALLALASCKV